MPVFVGKADSSMSAELANTSKDESSLSRIVRIEAGRRLRNAWRTNKHLGGCWAGSKALIFANKTVVF